MKIGKLKIKKGDIVKYKIPYNGTPAKNARTHVYTTVRSVGDLNCNFPALELNNGHEVRWNGMKYMLTFGVELTYNK